MSEVRYSVNGKYFKDWNVFISDSDGLFDGLKRKKVNSYNWAEYHGKSVDLTKPKFEAREITLKGFVIGDNWEQMKSNFDVILREFQKSGTQRLLIEPFGMKALPYEVYLEDELKLEKKFKEGKMVGVFLIKLIEPNPIKKVLYFPGDKLNLSFNSPTETEIFFGNGEKTVVPGNASIVNKVINTPTYSDYDFPGRNKIKGADFSNNQLLNNWQHANSVYYADGSVSVNLVPSGTLYYDLTQSNIILKPDTTYTVSFLAKKDSSTDVIDVYLGEKEEALSGYSPDNWHRFSLTNSFVKYSFTFTTTGETTLGDLIFRNTNSVNNGTIWVKEPKLEKGSVATNFSPAPEDEKKIIIAGNIEDITNLTTNAFVLWDKL